MNKRIDDDRYPSRCMDITALCAYTACGKGTARDIADRAGATIRIGRRVIYDRNKIDRYMDRMGEKV